MLVLFPPCSVVPYSFEAGILSTSTLASKSAPLEESKSVLEAALCTQCSSSWLRLSSQTSLLFCANICNSSKLTVSLNVRSSWIFCSRGNRKVKYRTSAGLSNSAPITSTTNGLLKSSVGRITDALNGASNHRSGCRNALLTRLVLHLHSVDTGVSLELVESKERAHTEYFRITAMTP